MAIVEDEVRNDSEEENEIEVVVEEDDGDHDSDDSEDDDDDELLEAKVAHLEGRIAEYPYNYDEHIELIQALWRLSELDRWRSAFDRLQLMTVLRPEHWLLRLQTETTIALSEAEREQLTQLFHQAMLDCYSIPILSEWCTWCVTGEDARSQLNTVLRFAGADPFSGKLFWDAKLQLEKALLDTMSEDNPEYKAQQERVLFCLEEAATRPLFRNEDAWQPFQEMALKMHDQEYVDKIKKQHDAAVDYLQKISTFEDKLLVTKNEDEKFKLYEEYIEAVKDLSQDETYGTCDNNGILKVLYNRATTECISSPGLHNMLLAFARHVQLYSSRVTYNRVLDACIRRCPRRDTFWSMQIQKAEREGYSFEEVKSLFETAISKDMETFQDSETLWISYLEYLRRQTDFENEEQVTKLRQTFRLAWDSLAEAWAEEANDCEIPLFWARLEYSRINDPKQGKEIFEEIFKYGDNKSMSRYWEAFIELESGRLSENKRRDLYRRALRFVVDYPPAIARRWIDYERVYGQLESSRECYETCEVKLKEWRESYHSMKEKMGGKKYKGKQPDKKSKFDKKKKKEEPKSRNKRKSDEGTDGKDSKRKKETEMEVEESTSGTDTAKATGSGVKRTHEGDNKDAEASSSKKQRREETESDRFAEPNAARDACTLFVSNLEFKVDEQKLRSALSKYGDIISMRVRAGVKAFGGSICYCQYNKPESVDEALKHDRLPLDGRPMFFSSYAAKKGKADFKYSTETEKNKLFVKNLPFTHCTKEALTEVFDKYGKLNDVRIVTFKDGKPKGLAYIEFEDEKSAARAIDGTHMTELASRKLHVTISAPPPKQGAATLGQPKREITHGMRRTQLTSLIPSVLQKPSTSSASNGLNADEKRPLSNSDFRSLLLKK